jgi:hypothetical protein
MRTSHLQSAVRRCHQNGNQLSGFVQRTLSLFSRCLKRWAILNQELEITLKPLSETWWECRLDSVRNVRSQLRNICEVTENADCCESWQPWVVVNRSYTKQAREVHCVPKFKDFMRSLQCAFGSIKCALPSLNNFSKPLFCNHNKLVPAVCLILHHLTWHTKPQCSLTSPT